MRRYSIIFIFEIHDAFASNRRLYMACFGLTGANGEWLRQPNMAVVAEIVFGIAAGQ